MNAIFNSHAAHVPTANFSQCNSSTSEKQTLARMRLAQQQQLQLPLKNAVVLNWEDVLAPMSFLHHRLGLQPSRSALAEAQASFASDAYLQQATFAIEEQILELLRIASSIGPTYIVSERSMAYMEAVCASFLPRLAIWLTYASNAMPSNQSPQHRVHVIAAPRSKFPSEMDKAAWLVNVLQTVCKNSVALRNSPDEVHKRMLRNVETGTFGLIHVSAAELDTFACVKAIDIAPFLLPKCVQVTPVLHSTQGGQPLSLEEFFAQLQTLQRYIVSAAAHRSAFAVKL
uniref:Uncharacterized protein n=1 Tax=Globisporangium ultimum (strain ATCC 200006 / CBS 805.95 / DAOM BR144) TaxID=431595 RepID=K3WVX4_GLOUD